MCCFRTFDLDIPTERMQFVFLVQVETTPRFSSVMPTEWVNKGVVSCEATIRLALSPVARAQGREFT